MVSLIHPLLGGHVSCATSTLYNKLNIVLISFLSYILSFLFFTLILVNGIAWFTVALFVYPVLRRGYIEA